MKTHEQKIEDLEAEMAILKEQVAQLKGERDRSEVSISEAAKTLGVSRATIERRIKDNLAKAGIHYSLTSSGRYLIKIGKFREIL